MEAGGEGELDSEPATSRCPRAGAALSPSVRPLPILPAARYLGRTPSFLSLHNLPAQPGSI